MQWNKQKQKSEVGHNFHFVLCILKKMLVNVPAFVYTQVLNTFCIYHGRIDQISQNHGLKDEHILIY